MCEHVILNDQWPKNCLKSDDCRGACVEAIKPDEVIKIIQERKILNDEMENRDFASGEGYLTISFKIKSFHWFQTDSSEKLAANVFAFCPIF